MLAKQTALNFCIAIDSVVVAAIFYTYIYLDIRSRLDLSLTFKNRIITAFF